MTERLYYHDAYLRAFTARVVDRADAGFRVYLDRTAFYPTSGGQPHDTGRIEQSPVIDVIDEDERIAHLLAEPLTSDTVHCEIDWARRFDHMQQHTGQHLLSAVFADRCGCDTVSVHFGPDHSTLDLATRDMEPTVLADVEREANALIAEPRAVHVSFEDAATAELRKASDRTGNLRVVSINGLDRSACGGTHVRSTAEIGLVLLRRHERIRATVRVEFVCGLRAVRRARRDYDALAQAARHFSSSLDDVARLVESQAAQLKQEIGHRRRLEDELDQLRARERYQATQRGPDGVRRIIERSDTGSPDEWKRFAMAFTALPAAIFIGATREPPAVLIASSDDSPVDAGATLRAVLARLGGRGGGSRRLAQGSLPSAAAVDEALRDLGER